MGREYKRGDTYCKKGWAIIVHEVRDNQVYYAKRKENLVGKDWAFDDEGWPLHRMDIDKFTEQVKGLNGKGKKNAEK